MESATIQANEADEMADFAPIFRGEGNLVAEREYPSEEAARFDFRTHRAELVARGIAVKLGRTWYAHRARLRAFRLEKGREAARAAVARASKPTVKLSAGQGAA
jgi:hypothetical protein